jgi:hypothetical protein
MTTTKSLRTTESTPPPTGRAKSVLFCQNCGHESPPDGDWLRDNETRVDSCPECGTVLGGQ